MKLKMSTQLVYGGNHT